MKNIFLTLTAGILFITTSCLKEDDGNIVIPPLEGATVAPEVGGAAQPNQVWIDLSNPDNPSTSTLRTDWDLGFYNGTEFRVILNNSILMAAAAIESNDIDAVGQSDFSSLVNILDPAAGWSEEYIDDVSGNFLGENGTAIDAISLDTNENKVYLIKLGYDTYQGNDIPPYSVYTIGEARGYKKVRILREGANAYKIQYADLDASTHSEFIVEKNDSHNFSFFSFNTESLAQIQPEKKNWDFCFTIFNNVIEGFGTYTYSDFIINNTMDGVKTYQVTTNALTLESDYNNFTLNDVDESLFITDDQRTIGGTWRSTVSGTTSTPVVYGDRFYVLKDPDGVLYKIRFLSMLDENNMRGYPTFEYEPL